MRHLYLNLRGRKKLLKATNAPYALRPFVLGRAKTSPMPRLDRLGLRHFQSEDDRHIDVLYFLLRNDVLLQK